MNTYHELLVNVLRNLPNIGVSKILAVMEELKGTAVVPIDSS